MNNLFLKIDGVGDKDQALTWSVNAALQRNKVYKNDENYGQREQFRTEWGRLLSEEANAYKSLKSPVSDDQHCAAIARIADTLSNQFSQMLDGGRLRFGTSQKAFNLYLKYLWALGEARTPPHCPIDSVVLERAGIDGCWTKSDSCEEYMVWINQIRNRLTLAEWENDVWLRWKLNDSGF
jgi:hypothetical protein